MEESVKPRSDCKNVLDLPEELIIKILCFLSYSDVCRFGCTCKLFHKISSLDSVWKHRIKGSNDHLLDLLPVDVREDGNLWIRLFKKASYAYSFRICPPLAIFSPPGRLVVHRKIWPLRGHYFAELHESEAQSIEIWLQCDPKNPSGIIIGCQSEKAGSTRWPTYHWQVLHVGPDGRIRGSLRVYCLLVGPVVTDGCWHHIVLVGDKETQKLYADGQLVDEADLGFGEEEEQEMMTHAQLGTGCISHGSNTPYDNNALPPGHCGYYPFSGTIREFRIWNKVLEKEDIMEFKYIQRLDIYLQKNYPEKFKDLCCYWPLSNLFNGSWPWQMSVGSMPEYFLQAANQDLDSSNVTFCAELP